MSRKTIGVPRLQLPQRQQMKLDERSLEQLLPPDHVVWSYVDGLDLSPLLACIKAVERRLGQPAIDPRFC